MADTRLDQQLDGPADLRGARIRIEAAVAHGLPDRARHRAEQPLQPAELRPPRILGEVVFVGRCDGPVDGGHLQWRPRLAVHLHGFGQSAHQQVLPQPA